jgi:hypothetical protein
VSGRAVITYDRASYPRTSEYLGRQAKLTAARRKALDRLAGLHWDEFVSLYRAEASARGVRLPALSKACRCGSRIVRRTFTSRWPLACAGCRETTG